MKLFLTLPVKFILFITLLALGCSGKDGDLHASAVHGLDLPQKNYAQTFHKEPFVHPRIVQDLMAWISDHGDQVVSINLLESENTNRYFGDITVEHREGAAAYVSFQEEEIEFAYQYVGLTDSGVHVLQTTYCGGGSGRFRDLLLLTVNQDHGIYCDWGESSIRKIKPRLLLTKLGEISLGDRWYGELKIQGNKIFVGKDTGHFTRGGSGGGWMSYDLKDRILSVDF